MEELFNEIPKDLDLRHVSFKEAGRVHDWRNHVPESIMNNWENLTDRERKIVYVIAEEAAINEEWD